MSGASGTARGAGTHGTRFAWQDWLDHELYPRLYDRLSESFPAFNFVRRGRAWQARTWPADLPLSDDQPRPDRLMVYENTPWLLTVHGLPGIRLLDLVNHGRRPVGDEFVPTVRRLAALAGLPMPEREVDAAAQQAYRVAEARREVLDVTAAADQATLWSSAGTAVRTYLTARGFTEAELRALEFGLHHVPAVRAALEGRAETEAIAASAVYWNQLEGYLILPWRDAFGRMQTLYGRWPEKTPPAGRPKMLALPGEGTKAAPLFFHRALAAGERALVAVEGILDAAMAQVRGDARVVAYVGACFTHAQIETLRRHRIESVVLVGDPDGGGDRGTRLNVEMLLRAEIRSYVPTRLPEGVDPDEFIQQRGIDAWRAHCELTVPGPVWVAGLLLAAIQPDAPAGAIDAALAEIAGFVRSHLRGVWTEQTLDAVADVAAQRTGRAPASLRPFFRAAVPPPEAPAAPASTPAAAARVDWTPYLYDAAEVDTWDFPPVQFLVEGLLPLLGVAWWGGLPKRHKSLLLLALCLAIACGQTTLAGHFRITARPKILYIAREDGGSRLKERIADICKPWGRRPDSGALRFMIRAAIDLMDPAVIDKLATLCRADERHVLILDTWTALSPSADPVSAKDQGLLAAAIVRLAEAIEGLVIVVDHSRKNRPDGQPMSAADIHGPYVKWAHAEHVVMLDTVADNPVKRVVLFLEGKDIDTDRCFLTVSPRGSGREKFAYDGSATELADARKAAGSANRAAVLRVLQEAHDALSLAEVVEKLAKAQKPMGLSTARGHANALAARQAKQLGEGKDTKYFAVWAAASTDMPATEPEKDE